MRTMTRYVLTELVLFFLAALVAFTGTMILVGVVREASKQGLPPAAILRLVPYILPEALRVAVPVTLLLAATSVYSRMAGLNEVVAIKALGISPMVILWPVIVLAIVISFVAVWLNDVAVSWGRRGAQQVIIDAVEEIAYGMLRTERSYSSSQFSIIVKDVKDRTLVRPMVTIAARGNTPAVTIEAESAELRADHQENLLKIFLRNCTVEVGGKYDGYLPEVQQEIPLSEASRADDDSRHPSYLSLTQIGSESSKQEQAIERRREELAAAAAYDLLTGDFGGLTGGVWSDRVGQFEGMQTHLSRLRSEPYRRWSAGFSCLCFVWVGAPMAIWFRNRDFLQSFFLCFAPILIVYYPLLIVSINAAKNGSVHPIAVWGGNLILVLWGTWILRKVLRY